MTMISATNNGRPRSSALLTGAAVLCATMATTAAVDSADARSGWSYGGYGHRAWAYDYNRYHHPVGPYYGAFYRGKYYAGHHRVYRGHGAYGSGHYYEGY